MSSELRAKILNLVNDAKYGGAAVRVTDRILALIAEQPATAKLPEVVITSQCYPFGPCTCDDPKCTCRAEARAAASALAAPPVPGESKPQPSSEDYHGMKFCLAREQDESAALRKLRDSLWARIAELEAELKSAGECDRCGKPASTLCRACEAEVMPAAKPDPRLTAPNGRAMVEYRSRQDNLPPEPRTLWGLDDEGKWWCWATIGWFESCDAVCKTWPGNRPLCRFDGTPLEETKRPERYSVLDPLVGGTIIDTRFITRADLLKLADLLTAGGSKFVADCVREVCKEKV